MTSPRLLTGQGTVWPHLRDLLAAPRSRKAPGWFAIAYIGSSAETWLPLLARDTLVCDASDDAVRLGLTSVAQLRRWVDIGVNIYSREGLHSKTGTVAGRAFVGSTNASGSSPTDRIEAALVTSEAQVGADVTAYVKQFCGIHRPDT